jgi:hypothetical protein
MLVYSPTEDQQYDEISEEIAREPDVERVAELGGIDEERVLYLAPPTEIDHSVVLALQRRLVEKGPENGGFSIVTGHTPAAARALYFRDHDAEGPHCMSFRKVQTSRSVADDDVETLWGGDVTTSRLRALQADGPLASLSLLTGGRAIHGYLSDGYLCGFPASSEAQFQGEQPYCVSDGERDCPLSGELISSDEINASHVFLQACTSTIPNRFAGLPVYVGLGLLENATSLIGVYRPVGFFPGEAPLHLGLLRAGYDLAERTYILNRTRNTIEPESHPYVCYGDPRATTPDPASQEYEVRRDPDDPDRVTVSDVDASVVDVSIPADEVGDAVRTADRIYVEQSADRSDDDSLQYTAFREEDRIRVLVYGWGRIERPELDLRLRPQPGYDDEWAVIRDCIENARRLDNVSVLDEDAKGHLNNLVTRVTNFSDELYAFHYETDAAEASADQREEIAGAIDRIQDSIVDEIERSNRTRWPNKYSRYVQSKGGSAGEHTCDYCGRELFLQFVSDVTGETERIRGTCPQHGSMFDVPDTDGDSLRYPRILGKLHHLEADERDVTVEFTNPLSIPMRGRVLPWLKADEDALRGRDLLTPTARDVELAPGESLRATFSLDVSRLPDNVYELNVYLVGNLNVYWGMRELIVGDTVGYIPQEGYRGRGG